MESLQNGKISIVDHWNTLCNYCFLNVDEHLMIQCVEKFLIIWIQLTLDSYENNIEKGNKQHLDKQKYI